MSSTQPLPLGFFQFDNLVRNKIPFLLLTLQIDLQPYFGVLERLHLKNYSILMEEFTWKQVEQVLQEKQVSKHQPIVVFCEDGKKSEILAQNLSKQDYLNVYFFSGGFSAFKKEAP